MKQFATVLNKKLEALKYPQDFVLFLKTFHPKQRRSTTSTQGVAEGREQE